ncbi:hypothetical protein GOBAR_DD02375 [Gossypium barbadense]|nr:hypothetical protein GOBAR_DD02375 [Gossypium barbadense]
MAELCFSKGIMIMFVAVVLSLTTTASAKDSAMAPAPSMDTGAAFSPAVSGIAVMFSLIVSLVALLKHWVEDLDIMSMASKMNGKHKKYWGDSKMTL